MKTTFGKIIDKKKTKGKFKTILGAFDYIINRVEGWIKKPSTKIIIHLKKMSNKTLKY